jgi:hypothetical protein
MTREERQLAVLDGVLPPEILSDEDLQDLQERVMNAIFLKQIQRTDVQAFELETKKVH